MFLLSVEDQVSTHENGKMKVHIQNRAHSEILVPKIFPSLEQEVIAGNEPIDQNQKNGISNNPKI